MRTANIAEHRVATFPVENPSHSYFALTFRHEVSELIWVAHLHKQQSNKTKTGEAKYSASSVAMVRSMACIYVLAVSGCNGSQSALRDAGYEAQQISTLFYWMVGGGAVIWSAVVGLLLFALQTRRRFDPRTVRRFVIGGGALIPTLVLTGLLAYGLSMMPDLQRPAPTGSVTVHVAGVRWWWRVTYEDSGTENSGTAPDAAGLKTGVGPLLPPRGVQLANEIVLPVNEAIEFKLTSEDVIHSFWIPALGGKMDMIPGRVTRLKLRPLAVGVYRGVCAEYCGESHALMSFVVRVVERAEFDQWLANERRDATITAQGGTGSGSAGSSSAVGLEHFLTRGCGACHSIRGTDARGAIGPDLTHFGSRATIAAGWLPNNLEQIHYWLKETKSIKPGVEMPQFSSLTEDELTSIAQFLEGLK